MKITHYLLVFALDYTYYYSREREKAMKANKSNLAGRETLQSPRRVSSPFSTSGHSHSSMKLELTIFNEPELLQKLKDLSLQYGGAKAQTPVTGRNKRGESDAKIA